MDTIKQINKTRELSIVVTYYYEKYSRIKPDECVMIMSKMVHRGSGWSPDLLFGSTNKKQKLQNSFTLWSKVVQNCKKKFQNCPKWSKTEQYGAKESIHLVVTH